MFKDFQWLHNKYGLKDKEDKIEKEKKGGSTIIHRQGVTYISRASEHKLTYYDKIRLTKHKGKNTSSRHNISAVKAGKEILWMCQFMGELGYDASGPSLLQMDNQSTIAVSKNPEHHGKMKHL